MKSRIHSLIILFMVICTAFALFSPLAVHAEDEKQESQPIEMQQSGEAKKATEISGLDLLTSSEGFSRVAFLFDGKVLQGDRTANNASLTLEHGDGIGSLYLIFNRPYGEYTVTDNSTKTSCKVGLNGFVHEFIDLNALFGKAPTSVTISFQNGPVHLFEIQAFTVGEVPASVQKWLPPAEGNADLVLFSTHGDDEQLFFAGVLPYYARERNYNVQVVYFTSHEEEPRRMHEMLNGLWNVGVTCYPVFGDHPDFFKRSMEDTYVAMKNLGYPKEELLGFVVEQVRRFKPIVAVGHDLGGEYGHGMHKMYADLLTQAVAISNDESQYPQSAKTYGVWDVPKTYLHLYKENEIYMDWDQPLTSFDGMTAFEVTQQLGFTAHKSQYQDFAWYLVYFHTAAELPKYNPCYYGLYRSTVGEDVQKNDFFENVHTHEQAAQIAEQERLEAERLAAEEEARRKQEEEARLAEEQRMKEEQRIKEEAEAERARQEAEALRVQEEARQKQHQTKLFISVAADVILLCLVILLLILRIKKKKHS